MAKSIIAPAYARGEYADLNFTPLSELFTDPVVRSMFRDAERDQGFAFCIPTPDSPVFDGGAEAELEEVA
jgi:hypothetical protein